MPKSLKVTVHAKRVESLERDDFVIIYTEYGLQFLRCALSIGRTRKDKIFEIWVPSEDHATFSNQSSPTDATLIDSDYEVVFNLWEKGWCLLIPPKLYSINNYLLKGTFKDSVVNYVLNNNTYMGVDFFTIESDAREILFKSCCFNRKKSSSSSGIVQPSRTTSLPKSKNTDTKNNGDKVPFRQLQDFDSDDEDDSDVDESESEDDEPKSKKTIKRKSVGRPKARVARKAKVTVPVKASRDNKAGPTPYRLEGSRGYTALASPARNAEPSAMRKTVKTNNLKIFNAPKAVDNSTESSSPRGLIAGVFQGANGIADLIKEGLDTAKTSTSNFIYGTRGKK